MLLQPIITLNPNKQKKKNIQHPKDLVTYLNPITCHVTFKI